MSDKETTGAGSKGRSRPEAKRSAQRRDTPEPARPRRVVWITSDHMRHDHIGANGSPRMVTPALDRLSAHAVNFHQCYVQNPLCMPSRCSFMTGLYPQQTGVTSMGQRLPSDFEPTVATLFKAGGYQTAQIGKLHFEPHDNLDFDPRPRSSYGFDVFWPSEERGNYSDGYYHWLEGKYPEYAAAFRAPRSSDPQRNWSEREPQPIDAPWQASHAGWIAESACRYFASRPDQRHFVHLGFYNPHPPLTPVRQAWEAYRNVSFPSPLWREGEEADKPEPLAGMLQRRRDWSDDDFDAYRRGLAALVTEMDLAIGSLTDWLENNDMLDDTLIVFSSDHGDFAGDHRITHKGPAFYDSVMRTPLLLHWPRGLGSAPSACHGLIEMVDVMPTLMDLCGITPFHELSGQSVAEDLLAGDEPRGRDDVFAYHNNGMTMLRTDTYKYLRYEPEGSEVLYDLRDDDGAEFVNHAADAEYERALQELRLRALRRALATSASPRPRLHPY